jgi:SAM-dependent methyltransferase
MADGDAHELPGIADGTYDFVHSSHCLEHLSAPRRAVSHWVRVLKPGGYLVVVVPDEDMYEQGVWPSTFGVGHQHSFTTAKDESWSPFSIDVLALLYGFRAAVSVLKVEVLDATYLYGQPRFDQTRTAAGECAIEFVARKRAPRG